MADQNGVAVAVAVSFTIGFGRWKLCEVREQDTKEKPARNYRLSNAQQYLFCI